MTEPTAADMVKNALDFGEYIDPDDALELLQDWEWAKSQLIAHVTADNMDDGMNFGDASRTAHEDFDKTLERVHRLRREENG